jgi:hypothetical protein
MARRGGSKFLPLFQYIDHSILLSSGTT